MGTKEVARRIAYAFPFTRPRVTARARQINERVAADHIMSRAELLEFWQQPDPAGNRPADYIEPTDRSRVLLRLLEGLPSDARVLEVGCNVGRNLAHLANAGYTALEGVEISPWAVNLLRATYPQLADSVIHLGAAEDILPGLPGRYDVIFTMAVMMHIHPQSGIVFDEICRLTDVVLAIEPGPGYTYSSARIYPHDLRRMFERRGMKLVGLDSLDEPEWQPNDLDGMVAWRFERIGA